MQTIKVTALYPVQSAGTAPDYNLTIEEYAADDAQHIIIARPLRTWPIAILTNAESAEVREVLAEVLKDYPDELSEIEVEMIRIEAGIVEPQL